MRRTGATTFSTLAVCGALVLARAAAAADAPEAPPGPVPGADQAPATPPSPRPPPIGAVEEIPPPPRPPQPSQPGYLINTGEGDFLVVGGYVHADFRAFTGEGSSAYPDQFLMRQIRPVLEGTLRDRFDFRLLPDFAGGNVVVQEAFGDIRLARFLKIRVGKMKSPVGLERLQNSNAVSFAERAFPTMLAPNRDVGVQLFGDVGRVASYAVGVFNGAPDNGIVESDADNNKEGAARLFLTPFAGTGIAPLRGLGFGASGTWGAPVGSAAAPQLPTYVSPGQKPILAYTTGSTSGAPDPAKTVVAAGEHLRWDVQGYWYYGPFGLQSEYIQSIQRVARGTTAVRARHRAFEVTAGVVLTGEDATYRLVVPSRPFNPVAGGWGAVEIEARYHSVRFDPALFESGLADPTQQVREARAWGVGVNWYLDRSFRIMLDYDRTRFFGGASAGGAEADRLAENVIIGRAQVVF